MASKSTPWLKAEDLASLPTKVTGNGGTALYDAILAACNDRMGAPDWNKLTRRVLVVISDGDHNLSHVTRESAAVAAVSSGTMTFSFGASKSGFSSTPSPRGDKVMGDFAKWTDGDLFSISSQKDLSKALEKVLGLMNGMYLVTYTPSGGSSRPAELVIKSATKEKLNISYPKNVR